MAVVDQPAPVAAEAPESALTASGLTGETLTLQVLKGVPEGPQTEVSYQVPVVAGMVVLTVFVLAIDWLVTIAERRLLVWRPVAAETRA